ncbi:hypothetical protein BDW74DRAFT_179158 [Aspergillus multicolor]|uniref:zinc finger MYND domain-containing protein n=1 Tax=Aspergillus multicolor TaxID=41759 RepID=UPI003CCCF6AB
MRRQSEMSENSENDGQHAELSDLLANCFGLNDLELSVDDDSTAGYGAAATDPTIKYDKKENMCTICNAADATLCSRCHSASYCSKTCQRVDYPVHKILCRDVAAQSPRPAEHIRGIYFPVDGRKPEVIWVGIKRAPDGYEAELRYLLPDGTDFFSTGMGYDIIDENPVRCRQSGIGYSRYLSHYKPKGYAVALFCKNNLQYAPNSNKSFQGCLTAPETYNHPYRGLMIAAAAFLMKELDPMKDTWGWAPQYWDLSIGSVFAMRDNRKDLSVKDVEMLCTFVTKDAQPVIGEALENIHFACVEAEDSEESEERDQDELSLECRTFKEKAMEFITRENMFKLRG